MRSIFANIAAEELVFSDREMDNRLNLHALRAEHAREVYSDYVFCIRHEFGYAEQLKKEIQAR